MHEIAQFLRAYPPFDDATDRDLEAVVAATEIEFFASGAPLRQAGQSPSEHVYVIRAGHVQVQSDSVVLDLLGPGDLVDVPSMVAGLPAGSDAVAEKDVLAYRVPAALVIPLLSGGTGLRFVARSLQLSHQQIDEDPEPASPSVGELARPAVLIPASMLVIDVVAQMVGADATAAVVQTEEGPGILTDRDLRTRVLAADLNIRSTPVSDVMTRRAHTIAEHTTVDDALLEMLARGVRHLPVVDDGGSVVGVVSERDLVARQNRMPSPLRRSIRLAAGVQDLVEIARQLPERFIEAQSSGMTPERATGTWSVLIDSVVRRLIELRLDDAGPAPVPFTWLSTGSVGRREAVLSSDLDSALVWWGSDERTAESWLQSFAGVVLRDLDRCALGSDNNGIRADDLRFARSDRDWRLALSSWGSDPRAGQGMVYLGALADARALCGSRRWAELRGEVGRTLQLPLVRHEMLQAALGKRLPTGFVREFVVEHDGEHRGTMNLKSGAMVPVVDIGRCLGAGAGSASLRTRERLEAAGAASNSLLPQDARTLVEVVDLLTSLRLEHQSDQWSEGRRPDDQLAPATLSALGRGHLRQAFRAVARIQRGLQSDLDRRWEP